MRLEGKVAIVTGASRGIGKGVALGFAREGARVVAAARTEEEIRSVAEEARSLAGEALAVPTDVGDREGVQRLVRQTVDAYGRLDILFNNAGIIGPMGPLHQLDDAGWEEVVRVNLTSLFWSTRAALEVMLPRRYGRIINVSSIAGKMPLPYRAAYTATKHGVIGLTRSVAAEVAKEGITVNALCPGFTNTPLNDEAVPKLAPIMGMSADELMNRAVAAIPIGRVLEVDDLIGAAVYLASDESAAMTGEVITVCGGQLMV